MIFGQTLQGDVTKDNYGLAWLLNVLQADKMQGPLGSGESLSIKPGTNQLEEISTVLTVDGKMTLWLAMMGGIQNETREALKKDGLYDKLMALINSLYQRTFGTVDAVQDNTQFRLPEKPIVGKYTPTVHKQTAELIDLSSFWQYPDMDKWGDKTAAHIKGNKMIIQYRPGGQGGWGWAGGSLTGPLTPSKGSAFYFKGTGSFLLKLETKDKQEVFIRVNLEGENKWTKVPLDTAVGKTFFVMVIDRVMGDIVIADRFYSPDGKVPPKSVLPERPSTTIPDQESKKEEARRIEEEVGKIPKEEVEIRAKTEEAAIKEAQINQGKLDIMSMYNLSPDSNWGAALVSKRGNTLIVKHNRSVNGSGWSWAGESLASSYTLKNNEGIRITGKGTFFLKLEGSQTLFRKVDMGEGRSVVISDLPVGLRIERIVIDRVMPGTTVEIESMQIVDTQKQSSGPAIVQPDKISTAETKRYDKESAPVPPAKQGELDIMSMYNLSPDSNWGAALVSKRGSTLIVKHNRSVDGSGWSWAGESMGDAYTLKKNEGIRIAGKGVFVLKLEGSATLFKKVDMGTGRSVVIDNLPAGLRIERIVIDRIMPGTTVEIESMEIVNIKAQSSSIFQEAPTISEPIKAQMDTIRAATGISKIEGRLKRVDQITEILWLSSLGEMTRKEARSKLAKLVPGTRATRKTQDINFDSWLNQAGLAMAALVFKKPTKYNEPSNEDIELIATRIKEAGVELFLPKSQFRGDTISQYRGIIEAIGGKLRIYQHVEELQNMITNPEHSIVMAAGIDNKDADFLQNLKSGMERLRVMNFAKMEDFDKMSLEEMDNYEAEILSILLISRIITKEDFQDKGSPTYRMLLHLLEDYMPDSVSVESYIESIVMNTARLINTILKALPITAYKAMRQAVEVFWAA